jgi:hypothetical protein
MLSNSTCNRVNVRIQISMHWKPIAEHHFQASTKATKRFKDDESSRSMREKTRTDGSKGKPRGRTGGRVGAN